MRNSGKSILHGHIHLLALLLLAAAIQLAGSSCLAADNDHSRVLPTISSACEYDYPPFCLVKANGEVDGFSIDLIRAVLAAMNHKVTFKSGPWSYVKQLLETGEIQALPLVGRTPEREATFDFTFPYMTMHGAIVVRKDTEGIFDLSDLKGRKVAVMLGDNAEEFLRREKPDLQLITTPTFLDAFQKLSRGECDAVVIQRIVALRLIAESNLPNLRVISKPIMQFKQDFCFAVKEGDKNTLALLNEGLALVIADGTFRQLHAEWFAGLELPENRNIIIGGDHNYPPFEFIDEKGNPAGLNVDLTMAIARATGLKCEVRLAKWEETLANLESGKIDAIQGLLYSAERDTRFDFSQPHTINHCVSVVRKDSSSLPKTIEDLRKLKLVVQRGDIMHDFVVSNNLASITTLVESQEEALRQLLEGRHDCALVARLTAIYWIKKHEWKGLEISNSTFMSPEYGFAVQNNQKALLAKFSEGLKLIEESGEFREIQKKWFGIYAEPGPSLKNSIRYIAMVALPLLFALGVFFAWSWMLRKEVACRTEELKNSSQQFRSLIEGAPYAIFVQTDYCFAYVNKIACELFGAASEQELLGKPVIERIHPSYRESSKERMRLLNIDQQRVKVAESIFLRLDGKAVTVEVSAVPTLYDNKNGAMVYVRDITEQKLIADQLRQAQKMEAVGQLAGGVAHDYNNMLSVIMGYAEITQSHIPSDSKACECIDEIIKAAKRSGEITAQLLAFARQQPISPQILDLKKAINEALKMLRRLIGEDIELTWEQESSGSLVKFDPVQLDQILANLCVNARDAINGVGRITIKTSSITLTEKDLPGHCVSEPGDYRLLSVSDTGSGISKENLEKIFEPFYSTKALGKGTGLGLATVYGIVKQNNGFLNVVSELNKGTTFSIFLPAITGNESSPLQTQSAANIKGTGQTILIVEDDESILQLARKILEMHGYNTLTASTPGDAIEIFNSSSASISLLLTDVIMPGMNGKDLAGELTAIKPDLKCVFMSGYTADIIAHRGVLEEKINFISKPFSMRSLANKVSEVLNS